jgi:hypothetical protein
MTAPGSGQTQVWQLVVNRLLPSHRWGSPLATGALEDFERPVLGRLEAGGWLKPDVALLYDLPLEQLCGQLGAAADIALANPARMPHLALCLVGVDGAADLVKILPPAEEPSDTEKANAATPGPKRPGEVGKAPSPSQNVSEEPPTGPRSNELELEVVDARSALARLVQRRIDGFQISTGAQGADRCHSGFPRSHGSGPASGVANNGCSPGSSFASGLFPCNAEYCSPWPICNWQRAMSLTDTENFSPNWISTAAAIGSLVVSVATYRRSAGVPDPKTLAATP